MNLEIEAKEINEVAGRISFLEQTLKREEGLLLSTRQKVADSKAAQEILQLLVQTIQQRAHQKIAKVVSTCLSAVFDDPYEFKIEFDRKRGRTEARLLFVRNGLEVDPLTASGGGMVDVAAFALRVACLILHRPQLSRTIILDEPFKFVSAEYRSRVRFMLEELAKDMDVQIVMITHDEAYETGKVIHL